MGLKEDSARIKKALEKVIKNTINETTKPCFRLYKAKVVTAPNGESCTVELIGDSNTLNLSYSTMASNVNVGDFVWVATLYDSFSNATVFAPLDFNFSTTLLNSVYPVGSVYLSINNVSPASFLGGSWEQITSEGALWITNSSAGQVLSAGLPNISGSFTIKNTEVANETIIATSGAFSVAGGNNGRTVYDKSKSQEQQVISFNASSSNSIYGNSSTVQPPSYTVYAWKRIE